MAMLALAMFDSFEVLKSHSVGLVVLRFLFPI